MEAFCYHIYMNRAAFALMQNDKKEILLVKSLTNKKFINQWSLPGGVVEIGESLECGAKREVFEEVGLICEIKNQLRQIENKDGDDIVITTFLADYISGDITLQTDEISDAKWFSINDTESLTIGFNIRELFDYL